MLAAELAEEGVLMAEETAPTEDTEAEEAQVSDPCENVHCVQI